MTPRACTRGPTVRFAPRSPRASTTSTTRSIRSCRIRSTRCSSRKTSTRSSSTCEPCLPNDNVVAADYPRADVNPPAQARRRDKIPHTTLKERPGLRRGRARSLPRERRVLELSHRRDRAAERHDRSRRAGSDQGVRRRQAIRLRQQGAGQHLREHHAGRDRHRRLERR